MATETLSKIDAQPSFENIDKWVDDALTQPDSFALMRDKPKLFVTWSLGPIFRTRDSDNIQTSNANALLKHLGSDHTLTGWEVIGCSHWAVGHVDHLAFQVIEVYKGKEGDPWAVPGKIGYRLTRIARVIKKWFDDLEEYPVADADELLKVELEASLETIEQQSKTGYYLSKHGVELKSKLPTDWVKKIYKILSHNGGISTDGQGAWADEDKLVAALKELEFVQPEV